MTLSSARSVAPGTSSASASRAVFYESPQLLGIVGIARRPSFACGHVFFFELHHQLARIVEDRILASAPATR
jgi:hypothetical protein